MTVRSLSVIAVSLVLMAPVVPIAASPSVVPARSKTTKTTKLVIKVKGVKRGKVVVTGKRVRRTVKKAKTLKLKPGRYLVRAKAVKKGKARYSARPTSSVVKLKRGRVLTLRITYRKISAKSRPTLSKPTGQAAVVWRRVNSLRKAGTTCGTRQVAPVRPLAYSMRLAQAAERHARDMATDGFLSHYSSDGSSFLDRVYATGFRGQPGAESIARGGASAAEVVRMWAADPVDCLAMMDRGFDYMGVGVQTAPGKPPVTYWVQNFGYAN